MLYKTVAEKLNPATIVPKIRNGVLLGISFLLYNILRSMSKAGTPTDNAKSEASNGWIKEELYLDFGWEAAEDVLAFLDDVYYFNNRRPAALLGF